MAERAGKSEEDKAGDATGEAEADTRMSRGIQTEGYGRDITKGRADKEHASASELTGRRMHSEGQQDSQEKTGPLHGIYIMADDTISALEARRSVL